MLRRTFFALLSSLFLLPFPSSVLVSAALNLSSFTGVPKLVGVDCYAEGVTPVLAPVYLLQAAAAVMVREPPGVTYNARCARAVMVREPPKFKQQCSVSSFVCARSSSVAKFPF